MKVTNSFGIDVELDKRPTLLTPENRRGEDYIDLRIPDFEENDTDLIVGGDIILHFSNEEALKLAQQLIECAMKNVDKEFVEACPGVPPF